jgi:two-component system, cell cycle sensor histidine kinase and response regulator CckA
MAWGGAETILVVEDEPKVRALAVRTLREHGYEVLEASEGKAALQLVQEHPDLALNLLVTDVIMPQMNGRVLAQELKQQQPELGILYMSGYTDDAIVHHGVLEQGIAFLQKPFTREALVRTVRTILDQQALQKQ